MSDILEGVVTKAVGGVFSVKTDNAKFTCFSPKKLRYNNFDLLIGDKVKLVDLHKGKGNILEIMPRKNSLQRPEVANVDICGIVLACKPQPDFYLVDKILVNCFRLKIEPIIIVNKMDIDDGIFDEVKQNYATVCEIVPVSTLDDSVQKLKKFIAGNVVCFVGQSAVGKTSILKSILPNFNGKVSDISEKSGRGKHTTRHNSLHSVCDGFVVDTCGFSLCDIKGVSSRELHLYLDDFVRYGHDCKFSSCTHTVEPECAVKVAVSQGVLCKSRYDRYLDEYKELTETEKKQF